MNILVTGAHGQLGQELQHLPPLPEMNWQFLDKDQLDLTDMAALRAYFAAHQVDWCVNAAAYTAVDAAEDNPKAAYAVNAEGVGNLAKAARTNATPVVHISTDFVFGAGFSQPIAERASRKPLNVYGKSKAMGEDLLRKHQPHSLILRTSWLYSRFGKNFVKTMHRLGKEKESLRVVTDQIGTPTYAYDLAVQIRALIQQLHTLDAQQRQTYWGVYHFSNGGVASWYDLACAVMELSESTTTVQPIPTAAYPTPAHRPAYSLMDKQKIQDTFGVRLPHWRERLRVCIAQL